LARTAFRKWMSFFETNRSITELMQIFKKIQPRFPRFSRSKNIENLTFAIFYRVIRTQNALTLRYGCKIAGIPRHKVYLVLKSFNIFDLDHMFYSNEMKQIQSLWAKVRNTLDLSYDDISYMQKMYDSGEFVGMSPTLKAVKIVILYFKARQLQKFFGRLRKSNVSQWDELLRAIQNSKWCNRIVANLPKLSLINLAELFNVSISQIYLFNLTETWIKNRLVKSPKGEILNIGWMRIPEALMDKYFDICKRSSLKPIIEVRAVVEESAEIKIPVQITAKISTGATSSFILGAKNILQVSQKLQKISNPIFSKYHNHSQQKSGGKNLKIPRKPSICKGILGSPPSPAKKSVRHRNSHISKGSLGSAQYSSAISQWQGPSAISLFPIPV